MSTPRRFGSTKELVRACKEHGLVVRTTGTGHVQVLEDRGGFGPNKLVATFSSTPSDVRSIQNAIANVKRAAKIDVRFPPKSKPKPALAPEPEPAAPKVEPTTPFQFSPAALKNAVREAFLELIVETMRSLVPSEVPTKPPAKTEPATSSVYDELPGRTPRQRYSKEKIAEAIALYQSGESMTEIERTYGIAKGYGFTLLRRAGLKPHGRTKKL